MTLIMINATRILAPYQCSMTLVTKLADFRSGQLVARPIVAANIRQSHAIAQLNWRELSFIDWVSMIAYALRIESHTSSWIALQDLRGYVYAIGFFEALQGPDGGVVLRLSNCVIVDQAALQISDAMSDCLAFAVRQCGAQTLQIELVNGDSREQQENICAHFEHYGWRTRARTLIEAQPHWN